MMGRIGRRASSITGLLTLVLALLLPAQIAVATDPPPIADVGVNIQAPSSPTVGASFDYTIRVTNHGPNPATSVGMQLSLPTSIVTFLAGSSTDPTDTCSTSFYSCTLGTLAVAETTTITVTVRRDKNDYGYAYASISSLSDPYPDNNSDYAVVQQTLVPAGPDSADLGITLSAPSSPVVGAYFDYTITVTNYGPATATNVEITDTLPSPVTFGSVAPIACSYMNGYRQVGCYFASLDAGTSITLTISVKRESGYRFYNYAYVASDRDPAGSNNSASVVIAVDAGTAADISMTGQAIGDSAVGQVFDVTWTATNHGPARATGAYIYSYLPVGDVSFVSASPTTSCGFDFRYSELSCDLPTLDSGSSTAVTVTLRRETGRALSLSAYVYSDLDLNNSNDHADIQLPFDLGAAADVGVNVRAPGTPPTGSNFTYTIDVTNHGPDPATHVWLYESLPEQVAFVSVDLATCEFYGPSGRYVECSLGTIPDGARVTVKVTVRRDSPMSFSDDAHVYSDVDLNVANDEDWATVQVDPDGVADVGVGISAPATPGVGATFNYTITVTNHGPATAGNVRMNDVLPAQATFVSAEPFTACSYLNGTRKVSCSLGAMPSGASTAITVAVKRDVADGFTNTAVVTSDLDLNTANDSASASVGAVATQFEITVTDSRFSPAAPLVTLGKSVRWTFAGPGNNTATDASGMGLFDSGLQPAGSTYEFSFFGVGTFKYACSVHSTVTGKIRVPLQVSPSSGTAVTQFTLRWASSAPPAGYTFQIQRKIPGSTSWTTWLSNRADTSATFTLQSGGGTYSFRARLRKSNGTMSGWSPVATISVG